MLDVRRFRNEPDVVRAALARRGEDLSQVDRVIALDAEVRRRAAERDELRARIRAISNEVGQLFRDGRKDEASELQAESRALGEREKVLDAEADEVAEDLRDVLLLLPNLPSDD